MDFDTIVAQGEAGLAAFVYNRQQETLELEFKAEGPPPQGAWLTGTKLTDSAKKVLGKALSGMSNSAGGVLVLGISAKRAADGVDAADALAPFENIRLVETLVTQATSDLLQPRHDGIRLKAIATASDPTKGYIVIDVPRSERRPHRSEAKDLKQYFKRAAGSTFAMEHYDIEDAFRRVAAPELSLEMELSAGMRAGTFHQVDIIVNLHLHNSSQVTARHPSIRMLKPQYVGAGRSISTQTAQNVSVDNGYFVIASGADFMVHPGERRLLENLRFRIEGDDKGGMRYQDHQAQFQTVLIPYSIYAENMRERTGELTITEEDVRAIVYQGRS